MGRGNASGEAGLLLRQQSAGGLGRVSWSAIRESKVTADQPQDADAPCGQEADL